MDTERQSCSAACPVSAGERYSLSCILTIVVVTAVGYRIQHKNRQMKAHNKQNENKLTAITLQHIRLFTFRFCRHVTITKWVTIPRVIHSFIHSFIYLQANEQDIKISIKQTQSQPQYSVPHGRRRVVTPLTRDQKIKIQIVHICTITLESPRTSRKAVQLIKPFQ